MRQYKEYNEIDVLKTEVEGLRHNLAWYKSENTKYKILIGLLITTLIIETIYIFI